MSGNGKNETAPTVRGTFGRKSVACLATAVIVLLTIFLSGGRGLRKLRTQAASTFTEGVAGDGLSIAHDLNQRLENAGNLAIVARRYRPNDEALSALDSACEVLRRALEQSEKKKDMAAANRALGDAVEVLYRAMDGWNLDETDKNLAAKQYRSFLSAADTISHDGYNQQAREFNLTLGGFPAWMIRIVTGVKPLELFE